MRMLNKNKYNIELDNAINKIIAKSNALKVKETITQSQVSNMLNNIKIKAQQ